MGEHHGKIWWTELLTRDVAAAKAYYAARLGWTCEDMPMADGGTYTVAMRGGAPTAGISDLADFGMPEGAAPRWITYFAVDDVDAAVAATEAAGGRTTRPPFDVPGVGRFALVEDPTGAELGLIVPAEETGAAEG